jgi:hypothetical protein
MADVASVQIIENGFRNVVLNVGLVSDGSGITNQKIFDATSTGVYGVTIGGQVFYPGLHTKIIGIDFDVQDQKFRLDWEASANSLILAYGASPTDFAWHKMGGIPVPTGLAGATGSILLSTISPMPDATLSFILRLRKDIKQS